jgi:hypothetical protein
MPDRISIPVKIVNNERWAQLNNFGNSHIICAERCTLKQENYSFAAGHRVRLYAVKNNVHWKIPIGVPLDVSAVAPATLPPRRDPRR